MDERKLLNIHLVYFSVKARENETDEWFRFYFKGDFNGRRQR